jgi:hypothetical protein
VGAEEELTDEADRMIDVDGLKATLRFPSGTRRLEVVGLELVLCFLRSEDWEVVVYVQGVKRVGCSLQPIAAVRREGVAPSMFKGGWVGCGVEI